MELQNVCRAAHGQAISSVELPEAVVDVLTGLRNWLQDKAEPPVYVSDRRFMKAINMLQVAAHADGRQQVRSWVHCPVWSESCRHTSASRGGR